MLRTKRHADADALRKRVQRHHEHDQHHLVEVGRRVQVRRAQVAAEPVQRVGRQHDEQQPGHEPQYRFGRGGECCYVY